MLDTKYKIDFVELTNAIQERINALKLNPYPYPVEPKKPATFNSGEQLNAYRDAFKSYEENKEAYWKAAELSDTAQRKADVKIRSILPVYHTVRIRLEDGSEYAVWTSTRQYDPDEVHVMGWLEHSQKFNIDPETGDHIPEEDKEVEPSNDQPKMQAPVYLPHDVQTGVDTLKTADLIYREYFKAEPEPGQLIALAQIVSLTYIRENIGALIPA